MPYGWEGDDVVIEGGNPYTGIIGIAPKEGGIVGIAGTEGGVCIIGIIAIIGGIVLEEGGVLIVVGAGVVIGIHPIIIGFGVVVVVVDVQPYGQEVIEG